MFLLQVAQSESPESSVGSFLALLFLLQYLLLWPSSCLETLNHDPEEEEREMEEAWRGRGGKRKMRGRRRRGREERKEEEGGEEEEEEHQAMTSLL